VLSLLIITSEINRRVGHGDVGRTDNGRTGQRDWLSPLESGLLVDFLLGCVCGIAATAVIQIVTLWHMVKKVTEWRLVKKSARLSLGQITSIDLTRQYLEQKHLPYSRYKTTNNSYALLAKSELVLKALDPAGFRGTVKMPESSSYSLLLEVKPVDRIDSLLERLTNEPDKVGVPLVIAIANSKGVALEPIQIMAEEWNYDSLGCLARSGDSGQATEISFYSVNRKADLKQLLQRGPGRKLGEQPGNLTGRSRWFMKREGKGRTK
jgi:hypothetical protein